MFFVDEEDRELLVCQLCQQPFQSLTSAWLASPSTGGTAVWGHKRCIDGRGQQVLGSNAYRLRRGDFALRSILQRLLAVEGIMPVVRWDRGA
jgi:hypothetical protein